MRIENHICILPDGYKVWPPPPPPARAWTLWELTAPDEAGFTDEDVIFARRVCDKAGRVFMTVAQAKSLIRDYSAIEWRPARA